MKNVYVLVVEHPDEHAELYVYACYLTACKHAAREIADRCVDDSRMQRRAREYAESGNVEQLEELISDWIVDCVGGHEIHIEDQPILDVEPESP